jgi:hypothetical protein
LNEIGINAELLNFKYIECKQPINQSFRKISVYSYIAEGKEAFYGLDILLAVFEKYPHIDFKIIGCKGKSYPEFPNVKYYGWVDSNTYLEICNYTPVFIRLTEHDGYSKSVMEALASGNEVIWNMKHEQCHYVKRDANDVSAKLNEVIQIIENRNLTKNLNNISWAEKNLNKKNVLDDLIQSMQKLINTTHRNRQD